MLQEQGRERKQPTTTTTTAIGFKFKPERGLLENELRKKEKYSTPSLATKREIYSYRSRGANFFCGIIHCLSL
jgi:hypothetical protein